MQKSLEKLVELLQEERKLLLASAKDYSLASELDRVRTEKEKIIDTIAQKPEEAKQHQKQLDEIQRLSKINMELASNNMQFVQQLFEAIFEEKSSETYGKNGEVSNVNRSIINKKA